MDRDTAEILCKQNGGHLASVRDVFTNNFLSQIGSPNGTFWIGGTTNLVQGEWAWADKKKWTGYTNWAVSKYCGTKIFKSNLKKIGFFCNFFHINSGKINF